MSYTNKIQLGREAQVFVVPEVTPGTMVLPSANNLVIPSGAPEFNQSPSYTDSTEVRNSRSKRVRFADMVPAGTWSLPMYCRPAGTAGSAPDGHVLLYGAFGSTTTYAGQSVTYTPKNIDHISMSIFIGLKDMVFALIGATVNEFKANFVNKGAINFTFSGGFMTMKWCGKAAVSGFSAGDFTVTADAAKQFCVGMQIKIWDDSAGNYHNSGAGYTITAVGATTVSCSGITGYTYAANDHIEPYLPTGTEVGTAIEARTGLCYFDGGTAPTPIISSDVTLNNGIKYLEDEISSNQYPTAFIADQRDVKANVNMYLRSNDLNFFKESGILASSDAVDVNLMFRGGSAAGSRVQLAMPQSRGTLPQLSGDLEKTMAVEFQGLASATLEDEIKLSFY